MIRCRCDEYQLRSSDLSDSLAASQRRVVELLAELGANLIAGARWPVKPSETSSLEGTAMVGFRVPEPVARASQAMARDLEALWAKQA